MEEFDTSGLLSEYLDDARGHLDRLDSALLEIEKEAGGRLDVELLSELLGSLHTLKGNSGMMGFESFKRFVHRLEGVFKRMLEEGAPPDAGRLDRLFDAAAYMREALDLIEKGPKSPPDMAERAEDLLADGGDGQGGDRARKPGPAPENFRYIAEKTNVLKVDFERLDHLLNLAGELVIHRTKLAQVDRKVRETLGDKDLAAELSDAAALINKATSDLQEAIMKVRMLPIRHVFQRFPRMVRDLSRDRGKEVELVFRGEGTELDKTVIDEIGEPLLHLIRNAVDHGIEPPEERVRRQKSPVGEISLSASQEGNNIIITVSDNGAGIDLDRIRDKAVRLYSHDAVEAMGADNLLDLIFEPGFSTAGTVTEVSGRGVGLDVVKRNIARLGGMVEARSERGRGCVFTIKLPLTLAIIAALMVRAGDEYYAVPLAAVIESLKLDPEAVHRVNGREVIMLRNRVLPLVRLTDLFSIPDAGTGRGRQYVVVVGRAEKRVGIVVDGLMGRQEIVIKPLDERVGEGDGIAGATILGDGRVVLILDIAGLLDTNVLKGEKKIQLKEGA